MLPNTSLKPWWEYLPVQNLSGEKSLDIDWAKTGCSYQAMNNGLVYSCSYKSGALIPTQYEEIFKRLKELGGTPLFKYSYPTYSRIAYSWMDSAVEISLDLEDSNITWVSNNEKLKEELSKLTEFVKSPTPKPEGKVFVLLPQPGGGLNASSIGVGSIPLIRDNYRPEVLDGYDKVVSDLKSRTPLGRLSIFDGPPGTGKTYLVRALLNELPDVKFLILPANMASDLSGPQLLSALIESADSTDESYHRHEVDDPPCKALTKEALKPKRPLVLVIEDADACLSSRGSDNISSISSILNLSDGIIGNLLDLRIVCTTNAEIKDIDSAIMRTGRLSCRVEVNLLDQDQAQGVYDRLEGPKPVDFKSKKFWPLSDVYALAKGLKTESVQLTGGRSTSRKTGFCV